MSGVAWSFFFNCMKLLALQQRVIILAGLVLTMSCGFSPPVMMQPGLTWKSCLLCPPRPSKSTHPWPTGERLVPYPENQTEHYASTSLLVFPLLTDLPPHCTLLQWRPGHRALQEAQWAVQRASYCKVSVYVCVSLVISVHCVEGCVL